MEMTKTTGAKPAGLEALPGWVRRLLFSPPIRRFLAFVVPLVARTALAFYSRRRPRTVISGIEVVQFGGDDRETMSLFHKVQEALDLISRVDPIRFSRIRKDMRRVLIMGDLKVLGRQLIASSPDGLAGCFLDLDFLRTATVHRVAVVVVHEATHLRIDRAQVRQPPSMRDRVERVCMRAEISFHSMASSSAPRLVGTRLTEVA
jgi:hypothetical protein